MLGVLSSFRTRVKQQWERDSAGNGVSRMGNGAPSKWAEQRPALVHDVEPSR